MTNSALRSVEAHLAVDVAGDEYAAASAASRRGRQGVAGGELVDVLEQRVDVAAVKRRTALDVEVHLAVEAIAVDVTGAELAAASAPSPAASSSPCSRSASTTSHAVEDLAAVCAASPAASSSPCSSSASMSPRPGAARPRG